ncbi:hypothetical protein MASR2M15_11790 [Anaerolineales bacterium]
MKQQYRDKALKDLMKRMRSKQFDDQQNAFFQTALVFELNNSEELMSDTVYTDALDRNLLRLRLSDEDQLALIKVIVQMIASQPILQETCLWCLSRSKPELYIRPFLPVLIQTWNEFSIQSAQETIKLLKKAYLLDDETVLEALHKQSPEGIVLKWSISRKEDLSEPAKDLLSLIQSLNN